jgi:DNA-binding MarR family transcriptional regulator
MTAVPRGKPGVRHERAAHEFHVAHDDGHGEERLALRVWLRLLACANLIERRVRQQLRDQFNTTLPRFDVLAQLDATARERGVAQVDGTHAPAPRRHAPPAMTMSELSRHLMVTNGNLTSLVDRLARERLVTRAPSATDRRTTLVTLTPSGKASLDAMTPAHQQWIDDLFVALTHDERAQLYRLLGKLKMSPPTMDDMHAD